MDNFYCFCLGICIGLSASFFTFGHFWLGVLAGIPLGGVVLLCLVVAIVAVVEGPHDMDGGCGDGYRN